VANPLVVGDRAKTLVIDAADAPLSAPGGSTR
jgi:hypothetical protein